MQFQTRLRAALPKSVSSAWLSPDSRKLAVISDASLLTLFETLLSIDADQIALQEEDLANCQFNKTKELHLQCGRVIAFMQTPFGAERGFVVVTNERAVLLLDAEFNVVFKNQELVKPDDLCFFTSADVRLDSSQHLQSMRIHIWIRS